MGVSLCLWQIYLERVTSRNVSGIACLSQETWDHIFDLLRAIIVVNLWIRFLTVF